MDYDVIIIGAGVIGSSIARELTKYNLSLCLLEKNNDIGEGASGANSAIIHSGYDPKPQTLKQKFNVLGNPMFDQLCQELDVKFERLGSITVATNEEEVESLKRFYEQGLSYGVPLELIKKKALKELEPNLSDNVILGLYAPTCGIIDPFNLVNHLVENALDNGASLFLNQEVIEIKKEKNIFKILTKSYIFTTKMIINCAGIYSDKIASMIEDISWSITPRKGQYYVLDHLAECFVFHTIFPAPSKVGKGILISPTTAGDYLLGPTNEEASDKEDITTTLVSGKKIKERANHMMTHIPYRDEIRVFSGLRAHSSRDDFIIEPAKSSPYFINCSGIESPGLTSSPAIAQYVVEQLVKPLLRPKENKNFNPCIRPYIKIKELPKEEVNQLVKENSNYGLMICNCEQITLGEILDLYQRKVPIKSIKAIKRRLGVGMGRCQGGFCTPKIMKALSEYLDIEMNEINYDSPSSYILKEKVKP